MTLLNLFRIHSIGVASALGTLVTGQASMASPLMDPQSIALSAQDGFVRFSEFCSQTEQAEFLRANDLRVQWTSTLVPNLHKVKSKHSVDYLQTKLNLNRLNADPCVLYFEPNERRHVSLPPIPLEGLVSTSAQLFSGQNPDNPTPERAPNDPRFKDQWALVSPRGVQPNPAWELTMGSRQIKVAVIDTGLDITHPELSDRVGEGFDFIANSSTIIDGHGHGTHVSGVIGAQTNNQVGIAGLNSDVTILPIRAVPADGDETDEHVIKAFEFAANHGARVANCSFGKKTSSQAVGDVIAAAGEKGLLVVVAAGNDGVDLNTNPHYPSNFGKPNMIVVSATTESGKLAYFSNYGMGVADLAAPGAGILSTIPDAQYASWSGTSMATPQVAGIAALVFAANPALSVAAAKQVILSTVTVDSAYQGKLTTGGRVNAGAAVSRAAHLAGKAEAP